MKPSCEKNFEIIVYYSTEYHEFEEKPKYSKLTREVSAYYTKASFEQIRQHRISCRGRYSKHILLLKDKASISGVSCTCKYFVKSAVCAHLVAYSNINGLDLFDKRCTKKDKPKKSEALNKRGRKKGGRRTLAENALVREKNVCDLFSSKHIKKNFFI